VAPERRQEKAPRTIIVATVLILGFPALGVGVILAIMVGGIWGVVIAAATVLVLIGLAMLARAIGPAMRPQKVRYDHSWLTNLAGQTSVAHPGPAAPTSDERDEAAND
jgi:hypothetical protein